MPKAVDVMRIERTSPITALLGIVITKLRKIDVNDIFPPFDLTVDHLGRICRRRQIADYRNLCAAYSLKTAHSEFKISSFWNNAWSTAYSREIRQRLADAGELR